MVKVNYVLLDFWHAQQHVSTHCPVSISWDLQVNPLTATSEYLPSNINRKYQWELLSHPWTQCFFQKNRELFPGSKYLKCSELNLHWLLIILTSLQNNWLRKFNVLPGFSETLPNQSYISSVFGQTDAWFYVHMMDTSRLLKGCSRQVILSVSFWTLFFGTFGDMRKKNG